MKPQDFDAARLFAIGGVKLKDERATQCGNVASSLATFGLPAYRASAGLPTLFNGFYSHYSTCITSQRAS